MINSRAASTAQNDKYGRIAQMMIVTRTERQAPEADHCSTLDAARRLGLAVRSVQLMVDRGELQAWKTPGGHRRIARASVEAWLAHHSGGTAAAAAQGEGPRELHKSSAPCVLLIEDSRHFQNLVALLVRQQFPEVALHVADDGIAGLLLAGQLQPDVLLVDILLPGIDGGVLITSLRAHPAFSASRLIVITSLHGEALAPYRHALVGLPVIHKPMLVAELPALLAEALARVAAPAGLAGPAR
jgi:excisionase family DNA binding protein